jgi:hypothetical protein
MTNGPTINLEATTRALAAHVDRESSRIRAVGALAQGLPTIVLVARKGETVREVMRSLAGQIDMEVRDFLAMPSAEAFRRLREQVR